MSKYFKQGSTVEYVEDYAEIQSLKFENARHSVLGFMLGDFDELGNYVISQQIVEELISMPKYIVEVVDNFEICKSLLKLDKQISFLITYEGERVTLSLIENVNFEANSKANLGSWSNINEYVLDKVMVSGEVNRNAIYDRWNISEFGGAQLDVMDCEPELLEKYLGIVNRFKFVLEQNINLIEKEEELESIEEEYFLNIFTVLEDYPELKKNVIKELKQNLEEKKDFIQFDKPNFTKSLNEILNKAIENNIKEIPEEQQQKFKQVQHNALVRSNIQRQEVIQCVTEKTSSLMEERAATKEKEREVVVFETTTEYKTKTIPELAQQFVLAKKVAEERARKTAVENLFARWVKEESEKTETKPETKPEKINPKQTNQQKIINILSGEVNYNIRKNISSETSKGVEEKQKQAKKEKAEQRVENPTPTEKVTPAANTTTPPQTRGTDNKKGQAKVTKQQKGGTNTARRSQQGTDTETPTVKQDATGITPTVKKNTNGKRSESTLISRVVYGPGKSTDETIEKKQPDDTGKDTKKEKIIGKMTAEQIADLENSFMEETKDNKATKNSDNKNITEIDTKHSVDDQKLLGGKGNTTQVETDTTVTEETIIIQGNVNFETDEITV